MWPADPCFTYRLYYRAFKIIENIGNDQKVIWSWFMIKHVIFVKNDKKICFGFALPNYRLSLERWNFNWTESLWINVIFLFDIHLSRLSLYLNRTISPKIHFSYWTLKFRNVQILFYRFANGSKTAQKLLKTTRKRLKNGSKMARK